MRTDERVFRIEIPSCSSNKKYWVYQFTTKAKGITLKRTRVFEKRLTKKEQKEKLKIAEKEFAERIELLSESYSVNGLVSMKREYNLFKGYFSEPQET